MAPIAESKADRRDLGILGRLVGVGASTRADQVGGHDCRWRRQAPSCRGSEFRGVEGAGLPVFRLSPDPMTSHTASANSVRLPRGRLAPTDGAALAASLVGQWAIYATPLCMPTVRDMLFAGRPRSGRNRKGETEEDMQLQLSFWQRLLLTVVAMLVTSWIAGLLWRYIFSFSLPSYAAGMVGGLAALPCWEFLKRIRPSKGTKAP